jgi:uncharacterized membrane protein
VELRLAARKAFGLVVVLAVSASWWGCGSDNDEPPEMEPSGSVTWCQVRTVLEAKCQRCHVGTGLLGAPFPLVTYDDTQVVERSGDERRWEVMQMMVEQDFMPPDNPPAEKLTSAERTTLQVWFDEGAQPVGGTSCD